MKAFRTLTIALLTMLAWSTLASSQEPVGKWQPLKSQPTWETDTGLVLTDGTIMVHQYNSGVWWRLTPDINGSYVNGTWTTLASMQSGYAPLYFASAVMNDGRVLVEGGEYNNLIQDETNLGSFYDPVANKWTPINPPTGWSTIGDSPAVVQPDGTFMMGQGGQPSLRQVIFNATTNTWTAVGTGKSDGFSEEGFSLLPDGSVLVVDCENIPNSELYNPTTKAWGTAGSTIQSLPNSGGLGIVPEMGPLMQRPDGSVVAFGATTHTAIYSTSAGTWAKGPDYPGGNDMADAPASILPDGNVLVYTSPGVFNGTGSFFEFSLTTDTFTAAPNTKDGAKLQSWQARTVLLPTGQVMWLPASGSQPLVHDVEIYTSPGTVNAAWRPTISSVPATLTRGQSYVIKGTQFNGLSAGSAYGDDAQAASSYPLVRIRNTATKHIFYARTHNHSTMGIATGATPTSTTFDVPAGAETGASTLSVIANGIGSLPKHVTIQ